MNRLKQAMMILIANENPLGPEWLDRSLSGDWTSYRECHIGGDFLLIYKLENHNKHAGLVIFVRTGTHADLFEQERGCLAAQSHKRLKSRDYSVALPHRSLSKT